VFLQLTGSHLQADQGDTSGNGSGHEAAAHGSAGAHGRER
jgi:hypothetical protein